MSNALEGNTQVLHQGGFCMNGAGLLLPERRRHRSQYIALGLIAFTGTMMFTTSSIAAGGSSGGSPFSDIEDSQAVWVGLGILLGVYALIITEVVHRTLAAAVGGLLAILALSYYSNQAFTLGEVTTLIDWETIGLLLGMMVMVGILSTLDYSNGLLFKPTNKAAGPFGHSLSSFVQ